jgi:precorrin-2 dehydrogenase/sirohydrochlorin ferrochelatase
MNNFYPVLLNLKDKKCLIIGAGKVAERKLRKLYSKNIKFKIISPAIKDSFFRFIKNKENITFIPIKFIKNDLKGIFLLIATTDNKILNNKICKIANKRNILCNCTDSKSRNFINMAEIKFNNEIKIYISSYGRNLKKVLKLKKIIEKNLKRIKC